MIRPSPMLALHHGRGAAAGRGCLWLAAVCSALLGNGCDTGATGGSETTNGLTGLIRTQDGNPAAHAQVRLVPATYNPVPGADARLPLATEADAGGVYRFAGVPAGDYDLEAKDSLARKLLVTGLSIKGAAAPADTAGGTLEATGTLRIPFSGRHLPENAVLYVPGTTFAASIVGKLGADGFLNLPGLPEGDYPELMAYFPDTLDGSPIAVAEGFHIAAGDTARITAFQAWSKSRVIRFDLAAQAPLPDSLSAYALLVRLNAGNFDFAQASQEGRDVRFALRDGTPAAFQIESWNAAAKTAAIWVRVDSPVAGADSLTLFWGRKDAAEVSDGKRVFPAAQGFEAVWHLGEAANTRIDGYRDSGPAGLHATAVAPNPVSDSAAVIGVGKVFSDTGGQMTAPFPAGMGGNASFTITFWMDFRMAKNRAGILTLGQASMMKGFHFLIRPDTSAQFGPWDTTANSAPSAQQNHFSLAPYLGKWIHVATVFDGPNQSLKTYVNGELQAENTLATFDLQMGSGITMGAKLRRGGAPPLESNYLGALDEVRIYTRVLPESIIRWDYATQKENSAVANMP